jgi:hypothetical protein
MRIAGAIVVNLKDIHECYDLLIDEAHGLYVELSQDQAAFANDVHEPVRFVDG